MPTKNKIKKNTKLVDSLLSSMLAIIAGLVFGLIILLFSDASKAFPGFIEIIKGGLFSFRDFAQMLYIATPIIMTGLSVGFAFKTGLFNIGASGQFTMGAFVAVYIGNKWGGLGSFQWVVALICAAIAGALWASIPGFLKAFANVNEVITSIMTNYIGMYLVNMMITKTVFDKYKNQSKPVLATANIPKGFFKILFPDANVNMGIIIAIFFVIMIYILIEKTTFGFELKACGLNKDASRYAGINEKRNIILSMAIAGGLSGIGGALQYLSGAGKYLQLVDIIATEGFNGISVALLGLSNPIGILFSGLFIGSINVGGINLQLLDFAPEIINIIIAAIIYFGAFSLLFREILSRFRNKNNKEGDN